MRDLERLLAKAARPTATPRDLAQLRGSLAALPGGRGARSRRRTRSALADAGDAPGGAARCRRRSPSCCELLREALVDDPPALPRGSRGALETGYIRDGLPRRARRAARGRAQGPRVDRRARGRGARAHRHRDAEDPLPSRARLRRSRSRKAQRARVPADYERKQTLANAERFTTPALREMEERVRGATARAAALEREIFERVRQRGARARAARSARRPTRWPGSTRSRRSPRSRAATAGCGPQVDDGARARDPRRPPPGGRAAAARARGEAFVPNDTELDPRAAPAARADGPEHVGQEHLPAPGRADRAARADGELRAGASRRASASSTASSRASARRDRLARGESTFMVEMRETAEILAQATRAQPGHPRRDRARHQHLRRALDRVGGRRAPARRAAACGARTLFATHYHELADLARDEGARRERALRGARVGRRGALPAPAGRGQREPLVRDPGGAPGRAARAGDRARARDPAQPRGRRARRARTPAPGAEPARRRRSAAGDRAARALRVAARAPRARGARRAARARAGARPRRSRRSRCWRRCAARLREEDA